MPVTFDHHIPLRTADDYRRNDEACLYEVLRLESIAGLHYDGDLTVTAGPVTVSFTTTAVNIAFIDTWSDSTDDSVVTLVPSACTYGAIADIVTALTRHLAVPS